MGGVRAGVRPGGVVQGGELTLWRCPNHEPTCQLPKSFGALRPARAHALVVRPGAIIIYHFRCAIEFFQSSSVRDGLSGVARTRAPRLEIIAALAAPSHNVDRTWPSALQPSPQGALFESMSSSSSSLPAVLEQRALKGGLRSLVCRGVAVSHVPSRHATSRLTSYPIALCLALPLPPLRPPPSCPAPPCPPPPDNPLQRPLAPAPPHP